MSIFFSNSILPPQKGDQVPSPRPWPWPSYALSTWLSRPTNLPYNDASSNTGKKSGNDAQERIDKEVKSCSSMSVTRVSKLEKSGKCHCSDCVNATEVSNPFKIPFQSYQKISATSTNTSGSTSTHSRNNFNYHQGEIDLRTFKAPRDEYNKNISAIDATGTSTGAGSFKYFNSAAQQNVEPAASQCPSSADAEKDYLRTNYRPTIKIKLFKCKLCPEVFVRMPGLRQHWRTHIIEEEATYKCPVCDKRLKSKNYALHHLRLHMRDSPYKCDNCGMQFMSPANLRSHMNTHIDGGFQFLCSTCGALYKRSCHYMRHVKSCRGF